MKLLIASILLMLSFKASLAQVAYLDYKGKKDPTSFLSTQVRPIPVLMEKCLMPFTYVKFKINKDNMVDSLVVTNNFEPLKSEITLALALTNGHWNLEQTKDKWLIVPLIFYTNFGKNALGKGCDYKKLLADQNKEMGYLNNETNAVYFPMAVISSGWN